MLGNITHKVVNKNDMFYTKHLEFKLFYFKKIY